jgi:hypothetical protein
VGIVISAVFTCLGRLPLKCRVVEIQSLAHLSREVAPVHSSRKCALSLSETRVPMRRNRNALQGFRRMLADEPKPVTESGYRGQAQACRG